MSRTVGSFASVGPHARTGLIAVLLSALAVACAPQSRNGESLHRAVLRGDIGEVRRILEQDPSSALATDPVGMTALHFTVARLRVSPELAKSQAAAAAATAGEPGAAPSEGSSRACGAAPSWTSYDLADFKRGLMREGDRGDWFVTTRDYAPISELLISYHTPVNAKAGDLGITPLHLASTMGHMSVARVLLAHGADIAAADRLGLTALHMVAQTGNVAMARLLLDQGANPNAAVGRSLVLPVFEGDTPLSLATICSRRDLVELLLQRGADPNVRLRDSFAALHLAESADIATLLIAHGASTTARGYEDRTPLHQAAMQGRLDVATVLLAHGSDIESKDEQGRTPLHLAVDQPASSPEIVALLLRHGANANARSSQQETALQAALTRDRKIVQILLDAGADVNSQDRWQRTSLHRAVQAGDPALVALLLSHGANVNARDSTNRTPLYYTWGGSAADREIARVLRRSGATAGTP